MKLVNIVLFLICLIFPLKCSSNKILSVEFVSDKSHVLTYLPLLEELASRGHEVTLVSPLKNMTKAEIREVITIDFNNIRVQSVFSVKQKKEIPNPLVYYRNIIPPACLDLYDRAEIQNLMKEEFDLVIFQPVFNECALGFVHVIMQRNNAPLILFCPRSPNSFLVGFLGGHYPPSFVPGIFGGFGVGPTFLKRVQNFVIEVSVYLLYNFYFLPVMEDVYREKLGADLPGAREILGSASIMLSNGHFSTSTPKPNLPDVVDVGGLHTMAPKALPNDLEDFIAHGKDGFIYVSFGTTISTLDMPPEKLKIFLSVFSKLKQQVFWKFETSGKTELPKNVKASRWLPQQDLLGHAQIKLFVTHCGMGGMEESIYHGVPLVGIPFVGDQPLNCQEAENNGFLVQLNWNTLTEDGLMRGIQEVLGNPKYLSNVQEVSAVFRDQIDKPLDRAVWWTEYVIRHKGAAKLRSDARKLNFFQYHSLDVIGALVFFALLTLYFVFKTTKVVCSAISKLVKKNELKMKPE